MDSMNKCSVRLKQALKQAGMNQQELANKSGVSKASISQYVHGRFTPSNETASKLGDALNVNPVWLMGFDVPMLDVSKLSEPQLMRLYDFYFKLLQEGRDHDEI